MRGKPQRCEESQKQKYAEEVRRWERQDFLLTLIAALSELHVSGLVFGPLQMLSVSNECVLSWRIVLRPGSQDF